MLTNTYNERTIYVLAGPKLYLEYNRKHIYKCHQAFLGNILSDLTHCIFKADNLVYIASFAQPRGQGAPYLMPI